MDLGTDNVTGVKGREAKQKVSRVGQIQWLHSMASVQLEERSRAEGRGGSRLIDRIVESERFETCGRERYMAA